MKEQTFFYPAMKFHKLIDIFANFFLWVLILIFVLPVLVILFLWKWVVILLAKLFCKHLHATDPNDTYFAIDDTTGMPIVNAAQIWRINGQINVNEFRKHFHSCFLANREESRVKYRNLYCYLVKFGGYVFKKSVSEIDLEKHIVERQLEPGTDLQAWITKWFVEEKFRDKAPLWSIVILHLPFTCTSEECETILLYKNHHCLADGYGFVTIVDKLTGNTSPYLVKEENDSFMDMIKDAFLFPKALTDYALAVARTKDMFYPIKNSANRKWFLGLSTVELNSLKEIRRQTKTHFTVVMMTLMIGALRRLMLEKGLEKNLPTDIYTANSLPWPKHPRHTLVNHWSGGVFKIPYQTSDPLERLREANKFFQNFHDIHMHKMIRRLIIPVTWVIPCSLLRLGHSMNLHYFRYSNTFASLLLSEKPHVLLGHKVQHIYLPLGLTDCVPTCVMFGVSTSHSGHVDMSILANSEIVSCQEEVDKLIKVYFKSEIENLRKRLQEANNNEFIVEFQ